MQVLMVGGQVVKNLRQEACGTNKSGHYTGITLELLGAELGLFCFFKDNKDIKHIRVMMDSNTAVA